MPAQRCDFAVPCAILSLMIICAMPTTAQQNLVTNPGFELDEDGDGLPDGWDFAWERTHSGDTADMDRREPDWGPDAEVVHEGARSIRTGVTRALDDGVWTQDAIALPEGVRVLRLSAWLRVRGAAGGAAHVALVYLGADGQWLGADYDAILVAEDTDWRRFVALFEPPKDAERLRLRLWTNFNRRGPVTAWYDDVSIEPTDLEEAPPLTHIDPAPMPALSAGDQARGFVPFAANYLDVVMPATVPAAEQLEPTLRIFAVPGEREPISFAVRALADQQAMSARITAFVGDGVALPEDATHAGVVRTLMRKMHPRTDDMLELPALIEDMHPVNVPAGRSQWYWFTVHVPEDAAPGGYRSTITISASGGEATIPVELEVLPITLLQPEGIAWGMYDYHARTYSDDPDALEAKFRDQAEHGMTSVGMCGNHGAEMTLDDGRVTVHWTGETDLERGMAAYVAAGFPEPVQWLMGRDTSRFAEQFGAIGTPEYAAAYAGVIRAILARAEAEGWPQIIFQPVDEAFEHRDSFERMMAEMRILKDLGVRVEADGMNGNPEGLDEALEFIDVANFHDGPFLRRGTYDAVAWEDFRARMDAAGKTIWFYNVEISCHRPENARFSQGFHLWNTGARGAFTWSYQSYLPDPYAPNEDRKFVFMHRFPSMEGEPGGPSIGFEALREGIDDYRYLATWDALCERALAGGTDEQRRIVAESRAWLTDKLAEIDYARWRGRPTQGEWTGGLQVTDEGQQAVAGHLKVPGVWDFADYDDIRRHLADWIIALQ